MGVNSDWRGAFGRELNYSSIGFHYALITINRLSEMLWKLVLPQKRLNDGGHDLFTFSSISQGWYRQVAEMASNTSVEDTNHIDNRY